MNREGTAQAIKASRKVGGRREIELESPKFTGRVLNQNSQAFKVKMKSIQKQRNQGRGRGVATAARQRNMRRLEEERKRLEDLKKESDKRVARARARGVAVAAAVAARDRNMKKLQEARRKLKELKDQSDRRVAQPREVPALRARTTQRRNIPLAATASPRKVPALKARTTQRRNIPLEPIARPRRSRNVRTPPAEAARQESIELRKKNKSELYKQAQAIQKRKNVKMKKGKGLSTFTKDKLIAFIFKNK